MLAGMKKSLVLAGAVLLAAMPLQAADLEATSKITEVTVYGDRARIVREATPTVSTGSSTLRFTQLPKSIDTSSIQAQVDDKSGVHVTGFEIRDRYAVQTINDEEKKLQAEIQKKQDELLPLENEAAGIRDRQEFLRKLQDMATREPGKDSKEGRTSVAELKQLFDFYSTELKTLRDRDFAIRTITDGINTQIGKINNDLAQIRAGAERDQKEVLVYLESEGNATPKVQLMYVSPNASWEPIYDAHADVDSSTVELFLNATVRQKTGEDWSGVKLRLATARPQAGGRMPELFPWQIDFAQPALENAKRDVSQMDQLVRMKAAELNNRSMNNAISQQVLQLQKMEAAAAPSSDAPSNSMVDLASSGISMNFDVRLPMTIPSDGLDHRAPLFSEKLKGAFSYATTPKLVSMAYLKARLTNSEDVPILPGTVNLFLDDAFIASSRIGLVSPTADFDFFLGVDDGVKVTRKELVHKTEKTGIFVDRTSGTRKYEIKVQNFKKSEQTITVQDQIPVSRNADLHIEGVTFSEKPTKQTDDTGMLEWTFKLKPHEVKTITMEFQASWPDGKTPQGL